MERLAYKIKNMKPKRFKRELKNKRNKLSANINKTSKKIERRKNSKER